MLRNFNSFEIIIVIKFKDFVCAKCKYSNFLASSVFMKNNKCGITKKLFVEESLIRVDVCFKQIVSLPQEIMGPKFKLPQMPDNFQSWKASPLTLV